MAKEQEKGFSLKPVIVLVAICIVISALLGVVNMVTAPVIAAAEAERIAATLRVALPGGTTFTEVPVEMDGVTAYVEDSGLGYVFVAKATGYKSDVTVTTGVAPDGSIVAIAVDASGETTGIGSKTALPEFAAAFVGISGSADEVASIAGATMSSTAVKSAVNQALAAYEIVKGAAA